MSVEAKIELRIRRAKPGTVFTSRQFLDLGSRAAVDKALSRLAALGEIRRLSRGLYDNPKPHPKLGLLAPQPDAIARALVDRESIRVQPSGAYAANLLHLSEQVPARVVFLTDGPTRKIRIGQQTIEFRRTAPRFMATAGSISGLVIQALKHLGQSNVTLARLQPLRTLLSVADRRRLGKDIAFAPTWMHPFFRFLSVGEADQ